jgi:hypothetical protein
LLIGWSINWKLVSMTAVSDMLLLPENNSRDYQRIQRCFLQRLASRRFPFTRNPKVDKKVGKSGPRSTSKDIVWNLLLNRKGTLTFLLP